MGLHRVRRLMKEMQIKAIWKRKFINTTDSRHNLPAELVCNALKLAIYQRQPKPCLVVHSNRGSQYASKDYQDLLNQYGLIGSMSRKGNCWHNSVMERFFLNLKMERVWRQNYAINEESKPS